MGGFRLGPKATTRGYRLIGFDRIGSTSNEAMQAATAGDAGEVWYVALEQTAGRGRRGRPWSTTRGNLAASLLLVPRCDPAVAAGLGFVAGVALGRALAEVVPEQSVRIGFDDAAGPGTRVRLKWPNDVLVDGAKLAGILLEAQRLADGRLAVVIGIGVNVVSAPRDLPYPATALAALGAKTTAGQLLTRLGEHWVDGIDIWDDGRGIADILDIWRRAAAGLGSEVAIRRDGDVVRGIFETIDDSGRLVLRGRDSERIVITAGDVHFGATAGVHQ